MLFYRFTKYALVIACIYALGLAANQFAVAVSFTGLGNLAGGIFLSNAQDVSSDGSVVVGSSSSASSTEAFRWTQSGGMVGLGDLPGGIFYSIARDVSSDGSVVVGLGYSGLGWEAFRWTQSSGMVGLGDLPGGSFYSNAWGVSSDGSVVVGASNASEAFRWTQSSGMVGLGDLPGGSFYSAAQDVSSDGSVVVGYGSTSLGNEAFIWDATNGMRNLRTVLVNDFGLDLTGWTLKQALGISDDGSTIVGYGTNTGGQTEAWVADLSTTAEPIPEPSTIFLFSIGGLGILTYVWRRRKKSA